jgi:hypothetical protein
MEYRLDIGEKLDLTRFRKHASVYIGQMRELTYNLHLPDYKVVAEIVTPDNCNGHMVTLFFFDIEKDEDGNIVNEKVVIPLTDTRFKEIKEIQNLFTIDHYKTHFDSNSAINTVDKICRLVKLVHKINHLKVFL